MKIQLIIQEKLLNQKSIYNVLLCQTQGDQKQQLRIQKMVNLQNQNKDNYWKYQATMKSMKVIIKQLDAQQIYLNVQKQVNKYQCNKEVYLAMLLKQKRQIQFIQNKHNIYKKESVIVQIDNDSILNSQTRIRLPGCNLNLPTISEQDEEDIINYGVEKGIDYISVSFCTSAQDIEQIKDLISPRGDNIKIIAKIENLLGLENFEEILQASDGIMIARGDLGMEIPTQKVFVAQKWIIERCLEVGKPVITATQMMESMIQYPRPTRAEASDVANAILDGTDAVLLSSETSKGKYPVECIQIISKLVSEAEMCYNNAQNFFHRTKIVREISDRESMATSAVQMSFDLKANTIVIFSMYGDMARMVCKYRPKAHIIVVSNMAGTIKGLAISCGIVCLKVPSFQGIDQIINYAIQRAKELNFCQKNEKVIVIMGSEEDDQDQSDILKVKVVT
ncbi:pyruvate kinase, putative [Ichthyophthirius multifiliis]|uniref:Pyruvate kinase n=1 Tax=Ichthyophthirius multifiliis TaxID=5932 RepID=G0R0J9_ICHMU|nr:pyruvate kinase, putative [Ichthyophthirius multifiliis]EGR28985.1 pyruvate kinase, putative [Ichthyophthirius multifiliis]|eukprot:XP_004030221.1 pyruvate kinase, putative [Ichthyophthirius multifiliis]